MKSKIETQLVFKICLIAKKNLYKVLKIFNYERKLNIQTIIFQVFRRY